MNDVDAIQQIFANLNIAVFANENGAIGVALNIRFLDQPF